MEKINARDKNFDLFETKRGKIKLAVVFLVALLITISPYFMYHNVLSVLTVGIGCSVLLYSLLSPAKRLELKLTENGIEFGKSKILYQDCDSWAVVDLGESAEIVIRKSGLKPVFYYFYIDEGTKDLNLFISELTKNLPYNHMSGNADMLLLFFRFFGLR